MENPGMRPCKFSKTKNPFALKRSYSMCDLCAFEAPCIDSPCQTKIENQVSKQIDD